MATKNETALQIKFIYPSTHLEDGKLSPTLNKEDWLEYGYLVLKKVYMKFTVCKLRNKVDLRSSKSQRVQILDMKEYPELNFDEAKTVFSS